MFKNNGLLKFLFTIAFLITSNFACSMELLEQKLKDTKNSLLDSLKNPLVPQYFALQFSMISDHLVLFSSQMRQLVELNKKAGKPLTKEEELAYYKDFFFNPNLFLEVFNRDPRLFYLLLGNSRFNPKLIITTNLKELLAKSCNDERASLLEYVKENDISKIPTDPQLFFASLHKNFIESLLWYNERTKMEVEIKAIPQKQVDEIIQYYNQTIRNSYANCVIIEPVKLAIANKNIDVLKILIPAFFVVFRDFKNQDVVEILKKCLSLRNESINSLLEHNALKHWILYAFKPHFIGVLLSDLKNIGFKEDVLKSALTKILIEIMQNEKHPFYSILHDQEMVKEILQDIRKFDPTFDLSNLTKRIGIYNPIISLISLSSGLQSLSNLVKAAK